jgi:hypothetical protein
VSVGKDHAQADFSRRDQAGRANRSASPEFARAFKQTYGFSPRGFSRDRLLQKSKI